MHCKRGSVARYGKCRSLSGRRGPYQQVINRDQEVALCGKRAHGVGNRELCLCSEEGTKRTTAPMRTGSPAVGVGRGTVVREH